MNRKQFRLLRMCYRYHRRNDARWKPDPYRTTRQRQERPDTAGEFLKGLPERLREAVQARPLPGPAPVQRGPRARWYAGWRPNHGPGSGMTLHQRVAFRCAMRRSREVEAARKGINPVAAVQHGINDSFRRQVEDMEAAGYRHAAMLARQRWQMNMASGINDY